jgi:uronate dehydrogenase
MKVVITGSAGVIGQKVVAALRADHDLVPIDKDARGPHPTLQADLSLWGPRWVEAFAGAGAVIHLAANSLARAPWPDLVASNIDAAINVYDAAARAGVPRVVFASSNHVMGGYKDLCGPGELTTDLPPRPGTQYLVDGQWRDSTPYAATKLFGERLGQHHAQRHGTSVIAVRIGWNKPAPNRWQDIPRDRGSWFQRMWLSDRDCQQLFQKCIEAPLAAPRFAIIHGMSANHEMPWDLAPGRSLIGFLPQDGVED